MMKDDQHDEREDESTNQKKIAHLLPHHQLL
jgi:hypothetical protein